MPDWSPERRRPGARDIVLVADDFAMSGGITAGIESLAGRRRISATSAIVTLPRWREDGARLARLRDHVAVGLHLNLTLGRPLGAMPLLAPDGLLPDIREITRRALVGQISRAEIAAEVARQLDAFEHRVGFLPDHIDGHQHVHAFPMIRDGVIAALQNRFALEEFRPLVRVPADRISAILRRRRSVLKAGGLSLLSAGFARKLLRAGFPFNQSFAGVSAFSSRFEAVAAELRVARRAVSGGLHLVMCHPGVATRELDGIDEISQRRSAELSMLGRDNRITPRLWLPVRAAGGPPIDWRQEQERLR